MDSLKKLEKNDMKYIFFDIDGTLTDNTTGKIVQSAQEALDKLQENGNFVAIATGRAYYKAKNFLKEVGLNNMVCNGGNGLVINHQLVKNAPLDRQKALAVIDEAENLGYGILIAPFDSIDVYSKNTLFLKQAGYRKEPTRYTIDSEINYHNLENIYKIYISIPASEETRLTLKDTLGSLRFEQEYLMFQPDDKKQGIVDMIAMIKGNIDDVVVFGDDYNDLVMFDERFYRIAMGNACDELKAKADYITDRNTSDGIYNACRVHGWIK